MRPASEWKDESLTKLPLIILRTQREAVHTREWTTRKRGSSRRGGPERGCGQLSTPGRQEEAGTAQEEVEMATSLTARAEESTTLVQSQTEPKLPPPSRVSNTRS